MPPKKKTSAKSPKKITFRMPIWPERACRDMIPGEYANHSCEVVDNHHGPHASYSVPESVKVRALWEKRNPELVNAPAPDPFVPVSIR